MAAAGWVPCVPQARLAERGARSMLRRQLAQTGMQHSSLCVLSTIAGQMRGREKSQETQESGAQQEEARCWRCWAAHVKSELGGTASVGGGDGKRKTCV